MTSSTAVEQYGEAAVVAASKGRGEPEWLGERRAEAARAFAALPMPTAALRPWRYTDLAGLDPAGFVPTSAAVRVEGAVPAKAFVGSLAEGAATIPAVRERLGTLLAATEGRFIAANAARWNDGVLAYVPRGVAFEEPITITLDAAGLENVVTYPRILVIAEEQGELTMVVRTTSGPAPLMVAGVTEVFAAQASRVRMLLDDRWGEQTRDFTWVRGRLERDAELQVASLAIGGALLKQTVEVLLEGEGATSGIRAVALGDGDQHFDFVTLQDHVGPKTTSLVEVKSALAGASRQAYYGITRVGADAIGADADQTNRNLLLSGESKADSDPVLEILTANIVRCGHHAAVGPVDQEQLFYLESRGLDVRAALQQIVAGFFHSVVGALPLAQLGGLDEEITERVHAKLAKATL